MMLSAISEIKDLNDRTYLDALYRQHYPMLHNLAATILRDEAEAGDVITNAMLSLFSKVSFLRALEEKERVGYLRATVRNAAFKYYNAQTRRKLTETPLPDSLLFSLPSPVGEDPANILLKDEEFRQVHAALASLDKKDRQLLHLKYAVRLTAREIAQMTDAPNEAAIQMRLSRARRKRWERALDELGGDKRSGTVSPKGKRLGRTALLAILAAVLLLVAASALYRPILNWVESVHERYTQLQAGETAESKVAQWTTAYVPEAAPDGFSVSDAEDLGDVKYIEYVNSGGSRITFYQYSPCASVYIDTEKADKTITAWLDGQTAYLFQKDSLSTLYWRCSDCVFSVEYDTTDVLESEIKAFAEGIQWKP